MHAWYYRACVVGMLGLVLFMGQGCGKKSVQAGTGATEFQAGAKKQTGDAAAAPSTAQAQPAVSEQELAGKDQGRSMSAGATPEPGSASGSGSDQGGLVQGSLGGFGRGAGSDPDRLKGLEPVRPGTTPTEERVAGGTGGMMVAKAEPDAAGRRMEEMRQEELATANAALKDVFFGFDSWKITEEGKEALARDAQWLKENPGLMLSVEGYCDERGTQAYNVVLGEKRAKAVRNYLAELGVGAERMAVTSFGKERPFCQEHDEACYRLNRRAHLVVRAQ